MKNLLLSAGLIILLAACNKKTEAVSTTETTTDTINVTTAPAAQEEVYSCSMHPEITGKKGEKCSICEMDLTVAAAN